MRRSLPLLLILSAGCAGAKPVSTEIPSRRTTVIAIPEMRAIYNDGPVAVERILNNPSTDVVLAVKQSFAELGIPLTVDDPNARIMGNNDFTRMYRFGVQPLTQYVDCGVSANIARASTHRIYMSFLTVVETVSNRSSRVKLTLTANARDMAGSSSNARVPCGSTGKLERQLLDSVRVKLGS